MPFARNERSNNKKQRLNATAAATMKCTAAPAAALGENRCSYALLIIGVSLVIAGIVCMLFLKSNLQAMLSDPFVLRKDSYTFKLWTHPPADVFLEIYLMNVTNPEEAALGKAKPHLVNQGPYVFRELRRKLNATFYNNGTVSFYEPVIYFFDKERSRGNLLSDTVTTLDLTVAGFSNKFGKCNNSPTKSFDCLLAFLGTTAMPLVGIDPVHELITVQQRSIFKKYVVDELLFKGFTDPFLVKLNELAKKLGGDVEIPTRIGLFYGRNGTASGIYTVKSGSDNPENIQAVVRYNGQSELTIWKTPYANRIEGTIGNVFHPFLKQGETIKAFAGDLCRSSELEFRDIVEIEGLMTFLYRPFKSDSLPYPENPLQKGFCVPNTSYCPPAGLMDETPCFGEPTFMGKPHFLHADKNLSEVFEGLNPNEEEHDTFMYVDPITGSVLYVHKRLMVYFPYRPSFISKAANVNLQPNHPNPADPTTFFPLFWVNETAKVTEVVWDKIVYILYPTLTGAKIIPYVVFTIGILLITTAVVRLVKKSRNTAANGTTVEITEPVLVKQNRARNAEEHKEETTDKLLNNLSDSKVNETSTSC